MVKVHAGVNGRKTPRNKPTKPFLIYWKMCEKEERIHSSYVKHRSGDKIMLTDGSWMPAKDCFCTPEQAEASVCECVGCRAHRLNDDRGNATVEIAMCNYCSSLNVLAAGRGQCIKGCPGNFQIKATVRVPKEGLRRALAGETE